MIRLGDNRRETMEILADNQSIHQWKRSQHSGNTFATGTTGKVIVGRVPDGQHTLRGIARYKDGTTLQAEIPVVLDSKYNETRETADWSAAIRFAGKQSGGS